MRKKGRPRIYSTDQEGTKANNDKQKTESKMKIKFEKNLIKN